MKLLVGVVVYQRVHTIRKWLQAWAKADKFGAKLAVFHNYDGSSPNHEQARTIVEGDPDFYIPRRNVGCDLGTLQDTIRGLYPEDFKDWDAVAWFSDDFLPMKKDFLRPFVEKIQQVGIGMVGACYEPANASNKNYHFRTVAYALPRGVCDRLVFPADPMINRPHCFDMEHGDNNLTFQVERMGYRAVPAIGNPYPEPGYSHWPNNSEWMWDCDLLSHLNLWDKFEEEFK